MVAAKKKKILTHTKAQEYRIDIAALKANLNRSYAERIRRHDIALETMKKLQKAKFL
jgi:hypothetical protein